MHPYIADFACMQARLLVELDGDSHDARHGYDLKREEFLRSMGFHIIRFTNGDVMENVEGVVATLIQKAEDLLRTHQTKLMGGLPHPYPLPQGEGNTPALASHAISKI